MKKRAIIALLVVIILLVPLISAFSFQDFWNKITGKAGMCAGGCISGTTQCSGNGYQTCVKDSNGCYSWGSVTSCASGQTCSSGNCAAYCPSPLFKRADRLTNSDMPTGTETSRFISHAHDERVYLHGNSYDYVETWCTPRPIRLVIARDWKTGCEVKVCAKEGEVCCYQECENGGKWLMGVEPEDRTDCFSDNRKQWFVDELHNAGVPMDSQCYS